MQASVDRILREAWESTDADLAKRRLERLASSLDAEHPSAAASIREGLDETLTLQRLGIEGALYLTLHSTNPIENLNGSIATYTRNVKRWQGGSMIVRWASAAVLDATRCFRRIRGYRDLHRLVSALEAIEPTPNDAMDQRVA
jgi:putative transposase